MAARNFGGVSRPVPTGQRYQEPAPQTPLREGLVGKNFVVGMDSSEFLRGAGS